MASANDNGVRTATIAWKSDNGTSARVAVGRTGDHLVLAAADQLSQEERAGNAYISALSVIVPEDPFPGFSTAGNQMIWLKDYSENEGLAPQLEKAGMLRRVGRTIKQGFVELPLAEVMLADSEMLQQCALATCEKWESTATLPRFKRCSKCKRRYYCSTEHQHANWNAHKVDCKDLVKMRFADVEQRRRDADWSPAPAPADADAAVRDGTH